MVIDLQRCVGCGCCAIACKAEHNTRNRADGQSHNYADLLIRTEGTFPRVVHTVIPVMCNHCSDAPCVAACPQEPKAMFKTPEGITMHDPERCIGCRQCQQACPYSVDTLGDASRDGAAYSVISFNAHGQDAQPFWSDKSSMVPGCTASGAVVAAKAGAPLPAMNRFVAGDAQPLRKAGVVEKCTFCYHRTSNGLPPACVEVCPAKARIFGDQDDPASEISRVLKANRSFRLKEEKRTRPNVHYIGKYSARA
jgi:Fe-S-cluster-containing dehydrogenase component